MESRTLFGTLGVAILAGVVAALAATVLRNGSGNQFATPAAGQAEQVVRLNPAVVEWPNHLENQEAFAALISAADSPTDPAFDTVIPQDLSTIRVIAEAETTQEARTQLDQAVSAALVQRFTDRQALLEPDVQAIRQSVSSLESQMAILEESHRTGATSDEALRREAASLAKERESLTLLELSQETTKPPVLTFAAEPRRQSSNTNTALNVALATALFAGFVVLHRRAATL